MNQVETWFGILTRKAIRRGSFKSVRELMTMIDAFTRQWNEGSSPFHWVRTAARPRLPWHEPLATPIRVSSVERPARGASHGHADRPRHAWPVPMSAAHSG